MKGTNIKKIDDYQELETLNSMFLYCKTFKNIYSYVFKERIAGMAHCLLRISRLIIVQEHKDNLLGAFQYNNNNNNNKKCRR